MCIIYYHCHSDATNHNTDEGKATKVAQKCGATGDGETNYQPLVMSTLQESHIYKDVAKCVADRARTNEVGAARVTTDEDANYDATNVGATNYQPLAMSTLQESHVYKDVAKCVAVRAELPSPPRDCKGAEDEGVYETL